jgi:hypothetical protein
LHVAVEPAALLLERVEIHQPVAHVEIEDLVERPVQRIDGAWRGRLGADRARGERDDHGDGCQFHVLMSG